MRVTGLSANRLQHRIGEFNLHSPHLAAIVADHVVMMERAASAAHFKARHAIPEIASTHQVGLLQNVHGTVDGRQVSRRIQQFMNLPDSERPLFSLKHGQHRLALMSHLERAAPQTLSHFNRIGHILGMFLILGMARTAYMLTTLFFPIHPIGNSSLFSTIGQAGYSSSCASSSVTP